MEPWEEEVQRMRQWERARERLPRCFCCEEPVTSEQYLQLEIFGTDTCVCARCIRNNLRENDYGEAV